MTMMAQNTQNGASTDLLSIHELHASLVCSPNVPRTRTLEANIALRTRGPIEISHSQSLCTNEASLRIDQSPFLFVVTTAIVKTIVIVLLIVIIVVVFFFSNGNRQLLLQVVDDQRELCDLMRFDLLSVRCSVS